MRVSQLSADVENYAILQPEREADCSLLLDLDGSTPLPAALRRLSFVTLPGSRGRGLADCIHLASTLPVFSRRAVEATRDLLGNNTELVELEWRGLGLVAVNVTEIRDALDVERSEVVRFSSGRVMRVVKYEFFADRLRGASIFRLPELARSDLHVTDDFVTRVSECRLTGFEFTPVWPNEAARG
jgi:hypothetical protein